MRKVLSVPTVEIATLLALAVMACSASRASAQMGGMGVTNRPMPEVVGSVAFSSDGAVLAGACRDKVRLWDVKSGNLIRTLPAAEQLARLAFARQGKRLAAGSVQGKIYVWDPNTGELKQTLTAPRGMVLDVAFSPDGEALVSATMKHVPPNSTTAILQWWDLTQVTPRGLLTEEDAAIGGLSFAEDGKSLAVGITGQLAGTWQPEIRLWDVVRRKWNRSLTPPGDLVATVAFSPDAKRLVCGGGGRSSGGTVSLWEVGTGKVLWSATEVRQGCLSAVFSPDGKSVVGGSVGPAMVKLWDADQGRLQWSFAASGSVHALEISPDGQLLAYSDEGHLKLCDLATGAPRRILWTVP